MKRALITGVSLRSRGGEAMVFYAWERLKHRIRKFYLISLYPEAERQVIERYERKINLEVIPFSWTRNTTWNLKIEAALMVLDFLLLSLPLKSLRWHWGLSKYTRTVASTDCVLEIHGISFSDNFGITDAFSSFLKIRIAKLLDKDFYCMPQSYGPSDSKTILFLAKKALEHTKVAMPRGNISMDFLKRLGLKGSQVIFMPDLAFGYSNPDKGEIAQIRRKYAIDEEKNYVAIIPNILLYRWKGHGVIDNYADIINSTSHKYQYEYILIPHEYDTNKEGDRYLNKLIFDKVSDKIRIIKIDDLLSANEIKALISFCDFSICSRFHGMVSSLRMGVIPIVIGWAEKYKEIMQLYELEDLVFNYNDLELSVIKEKIDHIIEKNQELKNIVSTKNIATEKQLQNLGDIISV